MLLGALIGGSDRGRNTIRTALLQGPGRLRTFAGQALALATAVAASVALHQTGSLSPAGSQFPAFGHVAAALMLGLAWRPGPRSTDVVARSRRWLTVRSCPRPVRW
jgi:hypothetical protein